MRTNTRPTGSGMTQTGTATARRTRDAGYATAGSAALAPAYPLHAPDPTRAYPLPGPDPSRVAYPLHAPDPTRTRAQREAADRRAAQRLASAHAPNPDSVAPRRRLRVAPPPPVTVARAPFVAMLLGIVVAGVVGILVLNTMINANQFRLNDLQSRQTVLDQKEQQLRQGLAQQESPGSLVAAARKLGLVPAGTLAYIQMPNGTVVGVPQPATHTPSVTDQTGPVAATTPTPPTSSTGH